MQRSSAHGAICLKNSVVSEAWKAKTPVAREKSIQNHSSVMLSSDAYVRSIGVWCFGHMDARTRKCTLLVPSGAQMGNTHTISCAGCTEPASGLYLYEAPESPCEAHRIQ